MFTARRGYNCPTVRPYGTYALTKVSGFGKQAFTPHVSCKRTNAHLRVPKAVYMW